MFDSKEVAALYEEITGRSHSAYTPRPARTMSAPKDDYPSRPLAKANDIGDEIGAF